MNTRRCTLTLTLVLFVAVALAGCDTPTTPLTEKSAQALDETVASRSAKFCINVAWEGWGYLGPGTSTPLPAGPSFGLLPTEAQIGPYEGMLSSAVIHEEVKGNGATHIELSHLFVEDETGDMFWTYDKAVCSPSDNDPSTCRVNDNMRIVDGTGKFANAGGSLRNHGWITFFDEPDDDGRFGTLELDVRGRVCGDGL